MPDSKAIPVRELAIYLLKADKRPVEEFVPKRAQLKRFEIGEGTGKVGVLFVRPSKANPPRWAALFDEYLEPSDLGKTSSAAAVFLVQTKSRAFAITFGQGRHLLDDDSWEERFGLRVALNSIAPDRLRSLDKVTFDTISAHSRIQSSREASAGEFGLDVEQDLVRAVTGIPNDETAGRRLTGMDALHVSVRVDLVNLKALLRRYLGAFEDDSYKKTFPWVDHIAEVRSALLVGQLDGIACDKINKKEGGVWLSIPELVDWAKLTGFRFGAGPKAPTVPDVRLKYFLTDVKGGIIVTKRLLDARRVYALDGDDSVVHTWSVYKCLYAEVDYDGYKYVLTGGAWYRVDPDFVKSVDDAFASLPKWEETLPEYKHKDEGEYCKAVAPPGDANYALMDRKTIALGGRYDKIEFCDLFTSKKDLIHLKHYAASSVLSHLFAQGVVSGEAFRSEPQFRSEVLKLLPDSFRWPDEPPKAEDFRIVFGVISHTPGDLNLPFFSRVNVRQTARRLKSFGYRVAMTKVQVNEEFAKTKKYKPK